MYRSLVFVVTVLPYYARSHSLEARGPQSNATCQTGFQWADNSNQLTPCIIAAAVVGGCGTSNYNVPALTSGNHYNAPGVNGQQLNECSCSWAAYNLYSACTACQGLDSSILTWADYSSNCNSFNSTTTYYPSDVTTLGNTSIPYYATIKPTTWQNQIFDVAQAQNISNSDHPDVSGSAISSSTTSSSSKNTPVGAIVGGVIGGLAVLAIGALGAFYIIRKRNRARKGPQELDGDGDTTIQTTGHGRSFSDTTKLAEPVPTIYTSQYPSISGMSSPPPTTIRTGPGSIQTFSMYDTVSGFTTPPQAAPSTRYGSPTPSVQYMNGPDYIQPFIINPTPILASQAPPVRPATPRKTTSGLTYDSPNAPPPVDRPELDSDTQEEALSEVSSRPRLNPPAYSPYPTRNGSDTASADVAAQRREQNGTSHRPLPREKGGSDDSFLSSMSSLGSRNLNESITGAGNLTPLDAIASQMGYRGGPGGVPPIGGGRPMPAVPMLQTQAMAPMTPTRHIVNSATENDDETVSIA